MSSAQSDSANLRLSDFSRDMIIGVTGHRKLTHSGAIALAITSVLKELGPPQGENNNPRRLTLVSPLAEGADRLAAQAILEISEGILRVILPMAPEVYEEDFVTPESREDFRQLLAQAESVETLPPRPNRVDAYVAAGHKVVDSCDLVLAVWDEKPARGRGGAGEAVAYARSQEKPLIIINSEDPGRVTREGLSGPGGGRDDD